MAVTTIGGISMGKSLVEDGVFLEQPDIRERIKRMEWTVLDFLKSEEEG